MHDWLHNHTLAESLTRDGWSYETLVCDLLRAEHLLVEAPPKVWRADIADRAQFTNEVDLKCQGRRISVKSRNVVFTSPDDIPDNRNPLFVDTQRKWLAVDPAPYAVVCVSQATRACIWLPESTSPQWTTTARYDATRGYADVFLQADRSLWQPFSAFIMHMRHIDDGVWTLSNAALTLEVSVHSGVIPDPPSVIRKFRGQHFAHLVRWMRAKPDFHAVRL